MNLAPGVCDLRWLEPGTRGGEQARAAAQAMHSHEMHQLNHSHMPVSNAWGLARAQASLLQSVKKALKSRGVRCKTQPDPTAIPSIGLQLLGWLCRAAVGQFI